MATDEKVERIAYLVRQIPNAKWTFDSCMWPVFSATSPNGQEVELKQELGSPNRFSLHINGSKIAEDAGWVTRDGDVTGFCCSGPASRLYKEIESRLKPRIAAAEIEQKKRTEEGKKTQLDAIENEW